MPPKRQGKADVDDACKADIAPAATSAQDSDTELASPSKRPRVSAMDYQDVVVIDSDTEPASEQNNSSRSDSDEDDDEDDDMFETVVATSNIDVSEKHSGDLGEMSDDSMPELGTVELTVGEPSTLLSPKQRRPTVTKRARAVRRSQHIVELMCTVTSALVMNYICNDTETQARCLSLLPSFAIDRISEHLLPNKNMIRREWVSSDLHYLLTSYQSLCIKKMPARWCSGGRQIRDAFYEFLETRQATRPWHMPMMLTAMLRTLTFDARLCVGVSPLPLRLTVQESVELDGKQQCDIDMLSSSTSVGEPVNDTDAPLSSKKQRVKSRSPRKRNRADPAEPEVPDYWCEVFDRVSDRWMPINAYTGAIEKAQRMVKPSKQSDCKFAYILALDSLGYVRDITRRYSQDFVNRTMKLRLESISESIDKRAKHWWPGWIKRWENSEQTDMAEKEDEEMETSVMRSTMPKRISDFAKNPYYVLERNLCQNEVIYPAEPVVGKIRGESVYLRENVKAVRTGMAWMREGRVVRSSEKPIKVVKQRAVTARAKMEVEAREAAGKNAVTALYGEWQTELFKPPPVVDGRVPRNEYGRLDLFKPTMLPEGAVHVRDPSARRVCKELGIDAVEAVVGFEFRRGVSTPVIVGVVVPEESADLLSDALLESSHAAAEKQIADAERRAVKHWRRLLVSLQVRAEVDASFAARSSRQDGITFSRSTKGKEPEECDTGGGFLS
ncbi:Rad4-domain-containing protein [Martensiomyces pterosporus]|nr:Rad4-domain-containing protein [Martensiomyces pterosporus]